MRYWCNTKSNLVAILAYRLHQKYPFIAYCLLIDKLNIDTNTYTINDFYLDIKTIHYELK